MTIMLTRAFFVKKLDAGTHRLKLFVYIF